MGTVVKTYTDFELVSTSNGAEVLNGVVKEGLTVLPVPVTETTTFAPLTTQTTTGTVYYNPTGVPAGEWYITKTWTITTPSYISSCEIYYTWSCGANKQIISGQYSTVTFTFEDLTTLIVNCVPLQNLNYNTASSSYTIPILNTTLKKVTSIVSKIGYHTNGNQGALTFTGNFKMNNIKTFANVGLLETFVAGQKRVNGASATFKLPKSNSGYFDKITPVITSVCTPTISGTTSYVNAGVNTYGSCDILYSWDNNTWFIPTSTYASPNLTFNLGDVTANKSRDLYIRVSFTVNANNSYYCRLQVAFGAFTTTYTEMDMTLYMLKPVLPETILQLMSNNAAIEKIGNEIHNTVNTVTEVLKGNNNATFSSSASSSFNDYTIIHSIEDKCYRFTSTLTPTTGVAGVGGITMYSIVGYYSDGTTVNATVTGGGQGWCTFQVSPDYTKTLSTVKVMFQVLRNGGYYGSLITYTSAGKVYTPNIKYNTGGEMVLKLPKSYYFDTASPSVILNYIYNGLTVSNNVRIYFGWDNVNWTLKNTLSSANNIDSSSDTGDITANKNNDLYIKLSFTAVDLYKRQIMLLKELNVFGQFDKSLYTLNTIVASDYTTNVNVANNYNPKSLSTLNTIVASDYNLKALSTLNTIVASDYNLKSISTLNSIVSSDYNLKSISTLNSIVASDYNLKSLSMLLTQVASDYNLKSLSMLNTYVAENYNLKSLSMLLTQVASDYNLKTLSMLNTLVESNYNLKSLSMLLTLVDRDYNLKSESVLTDITLHTLHRNYLDITTVSDDARCERINDVIRNKLEGYNIYENPATEWTRNPEQPGGGANLPYAYYQYACIFTCNNLRNTRYVEFNSGYLTITNCTITYDDNSTVSTGTFEFMPGSNNAYYRVICDESKKIKSFYVIGGTYATGTIWFAINIVKSIEYRPKYYNSAQMVIRTAGFYGYLQSANLIMNYIYNCVSNSNNIMLYYSNDNINWTLDSTLVGTVSGSITEPIEQDKDIYFKVVFASADVEKRTFFTIGDIDITYALYNTNVDLNLYYLRSESMLLTQVASDYTSNTLVALNYYLKTYVDANYTLNTLVAANYFLKTYVSDNYTLNTLLALNYYLKTESMLLTQVASDYTENSLINLNYYLKTYVDANYTSNTLVALNYYLKTYVEANYKTNLDVATNYTLNSLIAANYFLKTFVEANYWLKSYVNANYISITSLLANYILKSLVDTDYMLRTYVEEFYILKTDVIAEYITKSLVYSDFVIQGETKQVSFVSKTNDSYISDVIGIMVDKDGIMIGDHIIMEEMLLDEIFVLASEIIVPLGNISVDDETINFLNTTIANINPIDTVVVVKSGSTLVFPEGTKVKSITGTVVKYDKPCIANVVNADISVKKSIHTGKYIGTIDATHTGVLGTYFLYALSASTTMDLDNIDFNYKIIEVIPDDLGNIITDTEHIVNMVMSNAQSKGRILE